MGFNTGNEMVDSGEEWGCAEEKYLNIELSRDTKNNKLLIVKLVDGSIEDVEVYSTSKFTRLDKCRTVKFDKLSEDLREEIQEEVNYWLD